MDDYDKICERCHKVMRTDADVCPDDGGKLHSVASPEALVGRTIDGKLTLVGVLGRGGMGVVYRARQHSMDREVAVKVLNPGFSNDTESVRRFLHEARAATRLDHPNVITVFDFGRTDDGLLYIVMELLGGHSLGSEIELGPLAPARAVHVLTQVADAVHHAHGRGLVHRDLKPENVYLVHGSSLRGDFVKVLDFGIAMMQSYEGMERITRTGAVCGTPAYMSPEQVLGDEVDLRSDIYSLGLIAYEMFTGAHPFLADTPMRQMLAHIEKPVPPFAEVAPHVAVPPPLEAAVRRALEKQREQRTPDALTFANELVMALGGSDPAVPVLGVPVASTTPRGVERIADRQDRRGFADTARAAPFATAARSWRSFVPYALVAAVLVVAVVFFATRPDEAAAERPTAVVVSAPPPVTVAPATVAPAATTTPRAASAETTPAAAPHGALEPEPDVIPAPEPGPDVAAVEPQVAIAPTAIAPIPITSVPNGASVLEDGAVLGTTPLELERPVAGARSLVFKRPGYRAETRRVGAHTTALQVVLTRLPRTPRGDAPGIIE